MAKEDVEKIDEEINEDEVEEPVEEFDLKIRNLNGEVVFEENELDYCEVEIGAMMDKQGKLKSEQLYYIIQTGDRMDEEGDSFEFEIYAPVESCVVVKQKKITHV